MSTEQVIRIHDVTLQPGTKVQTRYEITRHLGTGGFAQVFEAFDDNIERPVAIKFLNLHSTQTDPSASDNILARFKREAKLAAKIQHPNVVNIYDFGVVGQNKDIPYIVMELLSGHDLEEQIFERGPMDPARALPLFVPCLEALGEAHKLGIVHKDLKPSNLFLANPGQRTESLRIVDFGIAHIRNASEGRLTATGQILGTPQYLAPEYIDSQVVTPAFDVYQMGLILVETIIGKPVVDENHPLRCVKIHSMGELDIPQPLLDSELGPILLKALALDYGERFENAEEFADALAAIDETSIPSVDSDAAMTRLSEVSERLDSSSRLMDAQTGSMTRPTTDEFSADGSDRNTELAYGQSVSESDEKVMGDVAHRETDYLDEGDSEDSTLVPSYATETAISEAGIGNRSKIVVAILLLLVLTLGGVAAWMINRDDGSADITGEDAIAAADEKLDESVESGALAAQDQQQPGEDAGEEPDASAQNPDEAAALAETEDRAEKADEDKEDSTPITVSVETDPAGAKIYIGGDSVGQSPHDVTFDSGESEPKRLRVKHNGYYTRSVTLEPDDAPRRFVALDKRERRAYRPKPKKEETKPEPKPVPEPEPKPVPEPEPKKVEKKDPAPAEEEKEDRRMLIAP
ncbi:MAG: protein kinase domain-containing protein [Myxococcota bacterium]